MSLHWYFQFQSNTGILIFLTMFVKLLSIILTSLAPCICNQPPIISPASFLWLIAHVRPPHCRDILLAQCQAATMSDVFLNLTCVQMPMLGHSFMWLLRAGHPPHLTPVIIPMSDWLSGSGKSNLWGGHGKRKKQNEELFWCLSHALWSCGSC